VRIVHVISGYLPHETGGTQIHVRDLSRTLRARGCEVEIFTRLGGREHDEFALSRSTWEGVPVTRLTNNFDDLDRFERLYTHPTIDAQFDTFLEAARPDLVHIHHLSCLSTSMIAVARRRRLPIVMTLHDYWMVCLRGQRIRPEDLGICDTLDRERCLSCLHRLWPHLLPLPGPRSAWGRLLRRPPALRALHAWEGHVRRMLSMCQALVVPSRFHGDRFLEWGIDPARLFVAPHGFADRGPGNATRQARAPRHIGFIGTVIPSKGVHVLCDAFNQLARTDLVLHVHGEAPSFHGDTGYVERLRQLVRPGLDVRFHGRYEHRDLPALLAGLDVLVVPSVWWESFCLTVREGAVSGVPVIASRLGALEEAIDDGLAVGFRPGDAADLAQVLSRVLRDPILRGAMATGGARVMPLEASVTRVEEIYRVALSRARDDVPAGDVGG
jgi:glycosyltransferase involved in cell wall biosynthesis